MGKYKMSMTKQELLSLGGGTMFSWLKRREHESPQRVGMFFSYKLNGPKRLDCDWCKNHFAHAKRISWAKAHRVYAARAFAWSVALGTFVLGMSNPKTSGSSESVISVNETILFHQLSICIVKKHGLVGISYLLRQLVPTRTNQEVAIKVYKAAAA